MLNCLYRRISIELFEQMSSFHWHIVDSQSFPLVVPGFETISEQGAYYPTAVYTPANVADIVSYAGAVSILAEAGVACG
jgi:hexosaminidase